MVELILTRANFEQEVLKSEIPVLVDFWATWCAPSRMLAPIVEEIAAENEGKLKVGKVNVDEQGELAMQYQVTSIPTLLLFENGQIQNKSVGYRPKEELLELLW